jgi:pimeloyl-ACP methyl ester carboxylesterase
LSIDVFDYFSDNHNGGLCWRPKVYLLERSYPMPTHSLDGRDRVQLNDRKALLPVQTMRGTARTPGEESVPGVLGAPGEAVEAALPTLELADFVPAQPPVNIDLTPLPPVVPGVLGPGPVEDATTEVSTVEFRPDPGENAVYALLHEIQTPDGIIYDVSMPQSGVRGTLVEDKPAVLGAGGGDVIPGVLNFPLRRLVRGGSSPGGTETGTTPPGVLGGPLDVIESAIGSEVVKHILHVIKAPLDTALQQIIARFEGQPQVVEIGQSGTLLQPLDGAEAWRSRFDPAREHRVLLFIHGFGSNLQRSMPTQWIEAFGARYDAILGYNHPTMTVDPLRNANTLSAMVPPDVRLNVDIVAHSRGGLVARSLVELQPSVQNIKLHRLITCGTPHAGTLLADSERWDRLVSLGFTTASWLSTLAGVGIAGAFVPRALELVLRAGSQFVLDLDGIQAMDPSSRFLKQLNAPSNFIKDVRYSAVSSSFNPWIIEKLNYREALTSMAAQVFMQAPNDLIVPTPSMSSIDQPESTLLGGRTFETDVNHFGYFDHETIQTFAEQFFFG